MPDRVEVGSGETLVAVGTSADGKEVYLEVPEAELHLILTTAQAHEVAILLRQKADQIERGGVGEH